jgi:hypothetical protein
MICPDVRLEHACIRRQRQPAGRPVTRLPRDSPDFRTFQLNNRRCLHSEQSSGYRDLRYERFVVIDQRFDHHMDPHRASHETAAMAGAFNVRIRNRGIAAAG